ncbi:MULTISPECIES: protein-export chaperone SecB [Proteus]|uniref:protein-export chaperone SecB n=3 Tax=Morganellaceae TaxID=1903414 RepID=UPI00053690CC|nr:MULTISPECIES: protein-export chaperone SecB [Proteus]AUT91531.1 hypothetical protein MC46_007350 [Proteus mirabilis]AYY81122.1 hypothetical protein EGX81_09605 [Proteus vulgaris]EKU3803468.1 protein-export chaperone SecB [Proteus mirabilis]EKY1727358.1 protein-export chaperone SecB [Proteus mirabilis]ELD1833794.1 protein-export chaperone SecB [Proteus mirabilis]
MKIKLTNKRVHKLSIEPIEKENKIKKKKKENLQQEFSFEDQLFVNKNDKKKIRIRYIVNLSIESIFALYLEYDFDFDIDGEVDDTFKDSSEIKTSIPSYTYPYIKTFIETVITNCDYPKIQIPTINFYDLDDNIEIED